MTAERTKTDSDSTLDSAIIRLTLLQRSQMTSQGPVAESAAHVDVSSGRSMRVDPRQREVLRHPFTDGVK